MSDLTTTICLDIDATCAKCHRVMPKGEQARWNRGQGAAWNLIHVTCPPVTTKTITLNFEVPSDLDTPSEVLAQMKQLLLGALDQQERRAFLVGGTPWTPPEATLVEALLVEV